MTTDARVYGVRLTDSKGTVVAEATSRGEAYYGSCFLPSGTYAVAGTDEQGAVNDRISVAHPGDYARGLVIVHIGLDRKKTHWITTPVKPGEKPTEGRGVRLV